MRGTLLLVLLVAANVLAKEAGVDAGLVNALTGALAGCGLMCHALFQRGRGAKAEPAWCRPEFSAGALLIVFAFVMGMPTGMSRWLQYTMLALIMACGLALAWRVARGRAR